MFYADVSALPGTNCYYDGSAGESVNYIIDLGKKERIRLLGSGNYHYLSFLFMERLDFPFNLLVLDNHPDTRTPAFGDILSCGSWVRHAKEHLLNLREVYLWGVSPGHLSEEENLPLGVSVINNLKEISRDLPLYISLDKDVLSPDYAACDWDQGDHGLDEVLGFLSEIDFKNVIAFDICGDKKDSPTAGEVRLNKETNDSILAFLKSRSFS